MEQVRVSAIKVAVPYGTKPKDLIEVLESLRIIDNDMYVFDDVEINFAVNAEMTNETNR